MATHDLSLDLSNDFPTELVRHVVVVADRFAHFADGEQVVTLSELPALVAGHADACRGAWVVHVGQGIERTDWRILESVCALDGAAPARIAEQEALVGCWVAPQTVHKLRPENVLLANVRNPAAGHCAADLRIHRENELIIDHHTGEHVQGMVIVEAMRQICFAHFETGYRPQLPSYAYAGVWKRIDLCFQEFLFALPGTVVSEIAMADLSRERNLRFHARTSVWQNGREVASAEIEYAMVDQARFETLERKKAAQAARAYLSMFAE